MMKFKLIKLSFSIIFLLLFPNSIYSKDYSNTIDSLQQINSQINIDKNTKGKTLYNLSRYYYTSQLFDSSITYSRQAFQYSIENGLDTVVYISARMLGAVFTAKSEYDSGIYYLRKGASYFELNKKTQYEGEVAKIYSFLANCLSEQMRYNEAYVCYDKSESTYLKTQDTTGLVFNKIAKGNLFTDLQLYDKALTEYLQAINLSEKSRKIPMLSSAFTNISTVYKIIGDRENAKKYLFKAIEIMQQYHDNNYSGESYHNLARLHGSENNYDSAFYYNDLAIKIFKKQHLFFSEQSALITQCEFYLNTEQLNKAKSCLDSMQNISRNLSEQIKSKYFLLLSELSYKEKDFASAIDHAQKALKYAMENKNIQDQKNAYELLYKEYHESSDFQKALKAHEKYILFKDSMFNQGKGIAAQKIIVENIVEEKNSELKLAALEHERVQAKKDNWLLVELSSIIGLLSVLTIVYLMFKNQKQKVKITKSEMELVKRKSEEVKRELKMDLLTKELEQAERVLEVELLKKESEEIKKEIIDFSLQSLKNKEFIELIRNELKTIRHTNGENATINNLFAITNQFLINEHEKNEFQNKVEGIQKSFFEKLFTQVKLTKTEKKLAALLKLQLTSKEIAAILNVSEKSIEIYRSRLRKKLNIDEKNSLTAYFNNF